MKDAPRWAVLAVAIAAALSTACSGPDPNLTETGKGRPELSVEFPDKAASGEVVTAALEISNPGPGDIGTLVVSFARVGDPNLPSPIVEPRRSRGGSGIEAIRPEPVGESPPDATYTFRGIQEGESTTIEFDLRIPEAEGTVGNSIQVYDGAEIDRAKGIRIALDVTT